MATSPELPIRVPVFHPRKGILKKPAMNTNAQFGLATLWRRSKHKFTPQVVKDILASERFQHCLELWRLGIKHKKHDLNNPKCSDPMMEVSLYAMPYGAWQTTSPGALSHPFPTSHRCIHQMVARETRTTSLSFECPLVPQSKPSTQLEAVPATVASPSLGISSSLPYTILQDGVYQTCSSVGPTLQPQTGYQWLVPWYRGQMLLRTLVQIQKGCPQPIWLGNSGVLPSWLAASGSRCH